MVSVPVTAVRDQTVFLGSSKKSAGEFPVTGMSDIGAYIVHEAACITGTVVFIGKTREVMFDHRSVQEWLQLSFL